ncbi:MAG: hypothetical protein IPK29_03800 [Betaproteobacteria bacterium]|nr:hypothetical protein [Betaproteobacteria bacterium]
MNSEPLVVPPASRVTLLFWSIVTPEPPDRLTLAAVSVAPPFCTIWLPPTLLVMNARLEAVSDTALAKRSPPVEAESPTRTAAALMSFNSAAVRPSTRLPSAAPIGFPRWHWRASA